MLPRLSTLVVASLHPFIARLPVRYKSSQANIQIIKIMTLTCVGDPRGRRLDGREGDLIEGGDPWAKVIVDQLDRAPTQIITLKIISLIKID